MPRPPGSPSPAAAPALALAARLALAALAGGVALAGAATLAGAAAALVAAPARAGEPRVVDVAARRFEFSPRVVTLRQGEPVTLRLTSADVTHGFFQKALGIDTTIVPGRTTEVTLTPAKAGRYLTICDHFCGSGHGNMSMTIVVEEPGGREAAR